MTGQEGDIYVADITGDVGDQEGTTELRDDGSSHTTVHWDGGHISWGTSDRKGDDPHVTDHRAGGRVYD